MSDVENKTKITEIIELKCTDCFTFPVSPIYNCKNGHIICGFCFENYSNCTSCQEELATCGFAERLARSKNIFISCSNKTSGCQISMKSTEMGAHLKRCNYRAVLCFECDGKSSTEGKLHQLNNFSNHLKDVHQIESLISKMFLFVVENFFEDTFLDVPSEINRCPSRLFQQGNNSFLLHMSYSKLKVYFWVSFIGGIAESKYFECILKLYRGKPPSMLQRGGYCEMAEFSWKIPVLPVALLPEFYWKISNKKIISLPRSVLCDLRNFHSDKDEINETSDKWTLEIHLISFHSDEKAKSLRHQAATSSNMKNRTRSKSNATIDASSPIAFGFTKISLLDKRKNEKSDGTSIALNANFCSSKALENDVRSALLPIASDLPAKPFSNPKLNPIGKEINSLFNVTSGKAVNDLNSKQFKSAGFGKPSDFNSRSIFSSKPVSDDKVLKPSIFANKVPTEKNSIAEKINSELDAFMKNNENPIASLNQ